MPQAESVVSSRFPGLGQPASQLGRRSGIHPSEWRSPTVVARAGGSSVALRRLSPSRPDAPYEQGRAPARTDVLRWRIRERLPSVNRDWREFTCAVERRTRRSGYPPHVHLFSTLVAGAIAYLASILVITLLVGIPLRSSGGAVRSPTAWSPRPIRRVDQGSAGQNPGPLPPYLERPFKGPSRPT